MKKTANQLTAVLWVCSAGLLALTLLAGWFFLKSSSLLTEEHEIFVFPSIVSSIEVSCSLSAFLVCLVAGIVSWSINRRLRAIEEALFANENKGEEKNPEGMSGSRGS